MARSKKVHPNQLAFPTDIEVTEALRTIATALGKDVTQLFTPMFAKSTKEVPKLGGVALKISAAGKKRIAKTLEKLTKAKNANGKKRANAFKRLESLGFDPNEKLTLKVYRERIGKLERGIDRKKFSGERLKVAKIYLRHYRYQLRAKRAA